MPLFTPAQHEAYIQAKEAQVFKPSGIACANCQQVTAYDVAIEEMVFVFEDDITFVSEASPNWAHAYCSDCYDRVIDHGQRMREYEEELESLMADEHARLEEELRGLAITMAADIERDYEETGAFLPESDDLPF